MYFIYIFLLAVFLDYIPQFDHIMVFCIGFYFFVGFFCVDFNFFIIRYAVCFCFIYSSQNKYIEYN